MGIREGLLLRQYIDERAGKAEEMKQRALLYKKQGEGIEAKTQLDIQEYAQAKQLQQALLRYPEMREALGIPEPGAGGLAPAPGGPDLPPEMGVTPEPGQALRDRLTQPPSAEAALAPAAQAPAAQAPVQMPEATPPLDLSGTSPGQARKQALLGQEPPAPPPVDIPQAPAAPPGVAQAAARTPAAQTMAPAPARTTPPATGQRATIENMIRSEAQRQGVDPDWAVAVATQESSLNPNKIGDNGASIGLFQLQEGAARDAGIDPNLRHDPKVNTVGGVTYLKQKLAQAGGDRNKALQLYNGGGDPNYVANVMRYYKPGQRAPGARPAGQRVAGAGPPAPAPPVTGGLETPAATPAQPQVQAGAPDPQLKRFDKLRQIGQVMLYYGQANAGNQWVQNVNAMETAYMKRQEQVARNVAALAQFQLQNNPNLTPQQRRTLEAQRSQALIQANEVTNAREYQEGALIQVAPGAQIWNQYTGTVEHTSPYRPMVQGAESQVIQPPSTPGQPATVISPAPGKPPAAKKDYGEMRDEALLEIVRQGGAEAKDAQQALDLRRTYRGQTTGARAGESTTETAEAKRGLPISQGDPQLAKRTYDRNTGRLVGKEVPTGEVYDQTGGAGRYIDLAQETDQKQMSALHQLLPVVNKLSERYQQLYGQGGLFEKWQEQSRLKRGAIGAWADFAEKDTNFVALKRQTQALASRLGKAYGGETGNLSNQDIQRISQIFGQLGAMPDNAKVAFALLNDFYDVTEGIAGAILANPVFTWGQEFTRRPPDLEAPAPQSPGEGAQETPEQTEDRIRKQLGLPPRK